MNRLWFFVLMGFVCLFSQAQMQNNKTVDEGHAQEDKSYNPMGGGSKYLGKDIPFLDPSNANLVWDSKTMNLYNNQLVRARFEKYLNAPEQKTKDDLEYQEILHKILDMLLPEGKTGYITEKTQDAAWKLLLDASKYKDDARLCDSLATMVYGVWQSQKRSDRMMQENVALKQQMEQEEWNAKLSSSPSFGTGQDPKFGKDTPQAVIDAWKQEQDLYLKRKNSGADMQLDEIKQTYQVNRVNNQMTQLQSKMEFQTLILQLFMQRRFQHVVIGTRFYRALYNDGDTRIMDLKAIADRLGNSDAAGLKMDIGASGGPSSSGTTVRNKKVTGSTNSSKTGENSEDDGSANIAETTSNYNTSTGGNFNLQNLNVNALISGGARGLQALNQVLTSLNQLDALANEAMRDVDESLETFNFLLEQNELKSATERLMEAFAIGEYMPSIRVLPREKKRQVVEFSRSGNNLLSAIEVRDYDKAESLLNDIQKVAKDFDSAKATTLIQTAKTQSNMHLAKARNASMSGEKGAFENELKEAATIWPMNPDLKKVATKIFDQGDIQQQAIIDFDRYYSQKNFRQIYEDQVRFIAATTTYPEKQKLLKKVLEEIMRVESGIQRAQELSKRGDHAGAWESVEKTYHDYPNDPVLNQERARYTTEASDFVKNLRRASDLEEKGQTGSSLSWYLKAQKIYPPSEFAGDAINRLAKKIIPESSVN